MAHKSISHEPEEGHVNLTPMIDVTFQLIIFFMLVSELTNMAFVPVTLPLAPHAQKKPQEQIDPNSELIISIDELDRISFGRADIIEGEGQELLENLVKRLRIEAELRDELWSDNPEGGGRVSELQVFIRCDRGVTSEKFLYCMFACNQVPIYKVNVATKKKLMK